MKYENTWCTGNNGYPLYDDNIRRLLAVRPSALQKEYHKLKYYNFIHFGMNTFTKREWGTGDESPSLFNPSQLDTDQWCRVLRRSGSKAVIFTAKHHDGFCLFDSAYTDHTVMNSPYGKDIVKQLSASCKKYDMKLGIYLSPWDMHEKTYGSEAYNDFFVNQLTELCTKYGKIFCFWFDGACGEGADGKKQVYDWKRYYDTIRSLQPEAIIANCGPDVRWIGNEGGRTRKSEWNIVPVLENDPERIRENSQKTQDEAPVCFDRKQEDLGSREALEGNTDLRWLPAEADVPINHSWFYQDEEYYKNNKKTPCRTPEELAEIYMNTVGGNASLLLNVPADTSGRINEREEKVLRAFTKIINDTFKERMPFELSLVSPEGDECVPGADSFLMQQDEAVIRLRPNDKFRTLFIEEDINYSQRVENFDVYADGKKVYGGTVIGSGKIISFPEGLDADEVDIVITQSRSNPIIKSIRIFK